MIPDISHVRPLDPYRLLIRFRDGVEGTIDLCELVPFEGVFAPLRDPVEFGKVALNPELGTVTWPSGADLDPLVLYARLTGAEILCTDAHVSIRR